jgi:hypothetical protein
MTREEDEMEGGELWSEQVRKERRWEKMEGM